MKRVAALALALASCEIDASPIDDYVKTLNSTLTAETAAVAGVFGKTVDRLRDPHSLQVADLYVKTSADSATGCMEYRSKNGFGGYNVGYAVWTLKVRAGKGSLSFNPDSRAAWNKSCAGDGFADLTTMGRALIATIK